jgi:hypothetical protein
MPLEVAWRVGELLPEGRRADLVDGVALEGVARLEHGGGGGEGISGPDGMPRI